MEGKQSGLSPGRSFTDKVNILQQLTEKQITVGEELSFIDLEKMGDNVPK